MKSKRIAWDHLAFTVPDSWELSGYRFLPKRVTRVEIDDEYGTRLEAEWVRPKDHKDLERILKRYRKQTQDLTKAADRKKAISGLPEHCNAVCYYFKETQGEDLKVERHELVTMFYMHPDEAVFACFLLHFLEDKENPEELARLIAGDLEYHSDKSLVPWELFDIAFELPKDFVLENTSFDVGSKLLIFRWGMRRFYLWCFSCADMFLDETTKLEDWVTGYLNGFGHLRGLVFMPGENGEIRWKRRFPSKFANRDELARWCFKYRIRCSRDKEKNRVLVWLFSYRKASDLDILPSWTGDGGEVV